ncbi:purine nucleotide synthesis repressor [Salmonella bongori]|nr:purine nucleotide synthesis repressor [Salmonella bongori]
MPGNNLEKQRAYLSMMAQKRVDGLLVMCSEYPGAFTLHAGRVSPHSDGRDGLGVKRRRILPTRLLITPLRAVIWRVVIWLKRGHRDIGVIPGPLEAQHGRRALAGFMKAMEEALIKVPDNWIVQGRLRAGVRLPCDAADLIAVASPYRCFLWRRYLWRWALCAPRMKWALRVPPGRFGDWL